MEAPFNPTADPRPPNWGILRATSEEILRAIDTARRSSTMNAPRSNSRP